MRLAFSAIVALALSSHTVVATETTEDPYLKVLTFGFQPEEQQSLTECWNRAISTCDSEEEKRKTLKFYHEHANPGMEASDLVQLLDAISITPARHWPALSNHTQWFQNTYRQSAHFATVFHSAARLLKQLNYQESALAKFTETYQGLMVKVMKDNPHTIRLKFHTQNAEHLQPIDECEMLASISAIAQMHAQVYQSLVNIQMVTDLDNELVEFIDLLATNMDQNQHLSLADMVEIATEFGIQAEQDASISHDFAKQLANTPQTPAIDLIYHLLTGKIIRDSGKKAALEQEAEKLFNTETKHANVFAVRALMEILIPMPEADWTGFGECYQKFFDPKTMDGYHAADILPALGPVYCLGEKVQKAMREEYATLTQGDTSPYQRLEQLKVLSALYTLLPDPGKRQAIRAEAAAVFLPNMNLLQRLRMELAYAQVSPALEAAGANKKRQLLEIWNESKGELPYDVAPNQFTKLPRQFQLNQIKRFLEAA